VSPPGARLSSWRSSNQSEGIDRLVVRASRQRRRIDHQSGGLAHTSVVLRDAVASAQLPAVEVHLTNIHARDSFRRRSLVAGACLACVCGMGVFGYEAALEALARHLDLPAPA
jgi:3-dehydroquinate dehydratase-2